MKISYAITYKDESEELSSLLTKLKRWLSDVSYDYEIVVLQDSDGSAGSILPTDDYRVVWNRFDNDFAAHKNFLNEQCKGDFIFQIDADEYPSTILVQAIGTVIKENPVVDLYWVPRVNTVSGLTTEHIIKWGWSTQVMDGIDLMVVNWPDYQGRIYRNDPKIRWQGKVHEIIVGADKYTKLPAETMWALFHHKTIKRQEAQNAKYATMQR